MSDLVPAAELAARNTAHFPNEDATYRTARNALLIRKIELRRQIEETAALRRALPPGGEVPRDYVFAGLAGPVTLSELFGDKDTLVIYSFMYGPQRKAPCPMCTSMVGTWEGKIEDIRQRVAVAVTARSPIERLEQWKRDRGWRQIPFYSDTDGDFTRDYVSAEDADMPGYTVFTRRDGRIRHFWSEEIGFDMSDPGQDPRGAVQQDTLWLLLDTTPEGRGGDWYPSLSYDGGN
ncbi:DUF899 family protein [Martelella soudanensis]|uniref:DUF899 family protein n=1 Tax=unclassified Martelella TaxID=2629616 RepID=UPI0015DF4A05|nr:MULTISPECIES: DUF899 family protein [unclassified Martelella]